MASLRRTHVTQQKFYEDQRRREMARNDQLRQIKSDRVTAANSKSDDRVHFKRFVKTLAREDAERRMVTDIELDRRRREEMERKKRQEEAIAEEIERQNLETVRDERRRQQLRESSHELRDLERKLKQGYITKELKNQMTTRELATTREAMAARDTAREIQIANDQYEEEQREQMVRKAEDTKRYQQDLEKQLAEEEDRKRQAFEQFMKDKAMIDAVVLQIQKEDDQAQQEALEKKLATQREVQEFARMQEEQRLRREEQMREEDEIIKRQQEEIDARAHQGKAAKLQERAEMEALQERLAMEAAERRRQEDELVDIRQELEQEEHRLREEAKAQAEFEKRLRQRMEMQADREQYLLRKEQEEQDRLAEETEFRAAMMEKFARDDRLEQMNAQKRRMRALEHRRAVERLIEERRARQEFEKQQMENEIAEERARETERLAVIEEERQRMLREHAIKLLGYLPKGVIQGDADINMLGPDFERTYRRSIDDSDTY